MFEKVSLELLILKRELKKLDIVIRMFAKKHAEIKQRPLVDAEINVIGAEKISLMSNFTKKPGRIIVKIVNHLGDGVMKIFKVK